MIRNGPVTGGWARDEPNPKIGFWCVCLFPNLVVPTFSQTAVSTWDAGYLRPHLIGQRNQRCWPNVDLYIGYVPLLFVYPLFILFCRWRGQWQNNITRNIKNRNVVNWMARKTVPIILTSFSCPASVPGSVGIWWIGQQCFLQSKSLQ